MVKSLRERLAGWKEKAEAEVTTEAIGDSGRKIKEDKLEAILYDLEIALLESDVAFPVAKEIVDRLAEDLQGKRSSRAASLAPAAQAALAVGITKGRRRTRTGAGSGRRPDRHRGPDADEPEPHGPDEEDQARREAEPDPVHRRRARGKRRRRAGEAISRIRRDRRNRPHEDRRGREG